eukprot:674793-Rhodomonas_salina.4
MSVRTYRIAPYAMPVRAPVLIPTTLILHAEHHTLCQYRTSRDTTRYSAHSAAALSSIPVLRTA